MVFMPVVILMLDDYSAVPFIVHFHPVSVIIVTPDRAQEHCQNHRRNYHHGYLQMSHAKLHSWPQALP